MPEQEWPYYPRWSPDGERIYLRAVREQIPHVTIEYVPAAGGSLVEFPMEAERWLVSRVPGGGLNISPDGKRIVIAAYQEPYDPEEGIDVWTIPVDGGRPLRLTSDGSFEGYPCWSPDGKQVAFVDWQTKSEDEEYLAVYTVPAEGGEPRQLTSESDSVDHGAIAISPDGERIAFFSNGTIKTISTNGGDAEVLVTGVPAGSQSDMAWSPNGKKIAFTASIGGEAESWLISDFLPEER